MKQEVLDALIKDNRLVRGTVPLEFYEKDQRRLSFKGASKVGEGGREGWSCGVNEKGRKGGTAMLAEKARPVLWTTYHIPRSCL